MKETKDRISFLDSKGEENALVEDECPELRDLSVPLHSLARVNASVSWQQARLNWLQEGDANSKFFHGIMSQRRRRNAIQIVYVDGAQVDGVTNIRNAVFNHFSNHFKSINMVRPDVENLHFAQLNFAESGSLIRPFSLEEVKLAVSDCDNYKNPRPDGITFGFIKDFWSELQEDFMRFLTEFHRNGKLTKRVNSTFIALIPMVESPQRLTDFRPISLVVSMYKVLAKVLANRLRAVIGSVISDTQSAFVKGKQIIDGILIANEAVDESRRCNKEMLLFKVDFEKAYDSVDLQYLDVVMGKMIFLTLWRKWITECVGTAVASVLVNGSLTEEFPLEKGLRQGDPLSPFLFLLAAEGFSVMMKSLVAANLFCGYHVGSQNEVPLTHSQFADDTLIIGENSWSSVRSMRAVLLIFEAASRLKVNVDGGECVRLLVD